MVTSEAASAATAMRPEHIAIDLLGGDGQGDGWRSVGDYVVWTGLEAPGTPPLVYWETCEGGIVRLGDTTPTMHRILPGTPHHVAGLFGFWRVCDGDILYVRTKQGDTVHHAFLVGGQSRTYREDTVLWICPKCACRFGAVTVPGGQSRPEEMWRRQIEIVRAFNADEALRRCPDCGELHPTAYGFFAAADNEAEREARSVW